MVPPAFGKSRETLVLPRPGRERRRAASSRGPDVPSAGLCSCRAALGLRSTKNRRGFVFFSRSAGGGGPTGSSHGGPRLNISPAGRGVQDSEKGTKISFMSPQTAVTASTERKPGRTILTAGHRTSSSLSLRRLRHRNRQNIKTESKKFLDFNKNVCLATVFHRY